MRRIAGRTNSSNVTIADTGLPGKPNTGSAPFSGDGSVAKVMGLPGRMLTSQRCCSAPSAASAALTKS
jgi:hypothetical protein